MKKPNKTALIKFSFKFFGTVPNVYEIDELGKGVSNLHKEVSKKKPDGSRWFETMIQKPGRYKFLNINIPKDDPNYIIFSDKQSGIFLINENKEITIIE